MHTALEKGGGRIYTIEKKLPKDRKGVEDVGSADRFDHLAKFGGDWGGGYEQSTVIYIHTSSMT